jgi:hypothetical protein
VTLEEYNDIRPARYHPQLGLCYWNEEARDWQRDEQGQPVKVALTKSRKVSADGKAAEV